MREKPAGIRYNGNPQRIGGRGEKMLKLPGALERLKPWQRRAIGAAVIIFAGIPLVLEYNYQYHDFKVFGADTLTVLASLYLCAMAAWFFGLSLIVNEFEGPAILMADTFGKCLLVVVNCFMIMNLIPLPESGGPAPGYALLGAFWVPLAGSALYFIACLLMLNVRWAVILRMEHVLAGITIFIMMGYTGSIASYVVFEFFQQTEMYRFIMALIASGTMCGILGAWGFKLERWSWGELELYRG